MEKECRRNLRIPGIPGMEAVEVLPGVEKRAENGSTGITQGTDYALRLKIFILNNLDDLFDKLFFMTIKF